MLGQIILCLGDGPAYCRMFSSISGLCSVDASSKAPQCCDNQKLPDIAKCTLGWGGNIAWRTSGLKSSCVFYRVHQWPAPAAAAAKSLQSCPTLCDPIDGSPPGSPVPGILQARILERAAISFSNAWKWKVKVKLLSLDQKLQSAQSDQNQIILTPSYPPIMLEGHPEPRHIHAWAPTLHSPFIEGNKLK